MQCKNRSNELCCLFDIIFSTFKGAVKYSKAVFAYSKCLFNAISNGAQFPIQLFHEGISSTFGCFKCWDCMFCTRIGWVYKDKWWNLFVLHLIAGWVPRGN